MAEREAIAEQPQTKYYVLLSEAQAVDLASGYVAGAVKAQVLMLLDQHREDERRAARPVTTPIPDPEQVFETPLFEGLEQA